MQQLRSQRNIINHRLYNMRYSGRPWEKCEMPFLLLEHICTWVLASAYLIKCFCREEFKHYLRRPDLKQELVSQWQRDYNSKPEDMREDEESKAELHLRLDVRTICNK